MRFGLIIATKQMKNYDYNSLPAAGIGYLAGMIRKELPQVDVILSQDLHSLIREKPDIVGISSDKEHRVKRCVHPRKQFCFLGLDQASKQYFMAQQVDRFPT